VPTAFGCRTLGVEAEATQLTRGVSSLDASIRIIHDLAAEAEARRFVQSIVVAANPGPLVVEFKDSNCTEVDREVPLSACTLSVAGRNMDVIILPDTIEDRLEPARSAVSAHEEIVQAVHQIQNLATAGSVAMSVTAVRNASFAARVILVSDKEAADGQLDDLEDEREAVVTQIEEATDEGLSTDTLERDREKLDGDISKARDARQRVTQIVDATAAGVEFGEGVTADYLAWRLAKLRRRAVVSASTALTFRPCDPGGVPSDPLCVSTLEERTADIAKAVDLRLALVVDYATALVEFDQAILNCALQRASAIGDGAPTDGGEDNCRGVDGAQGFGREAIQPNRKAGVAPLPVKSIPIDLAHRRLAASRRVLESLRLLHNYPQQRPLSSCGSGREDLGDSLPASLVLQYHDVVEQLSILAEDPESKKAPRTCFIAFEARAQATLETLSQIRQLVAARLQLGTEVEAR
jgi:hypothetical protein